MLHLDRHVSPCRLLKWECCRHVIFSRSARKQQCELCVKYRPDKSAQSASWWFSVLGIIDLYFYPQMRNVLARISCAAHMFDFLAGWLIFVYITGTMDRTVSDMWRMIWSQDIYNIIMLTSCCENTMVIL